ncbi:MAG TPA: helix-turn-helix transcriptional regulator [Parapedobacter sp.]|nr:helix-turn-helix transcriptional regulator [Parapedobacter sp.]
MSDYKYIKIKEFRKYVDEILRRRFPRKTGFEKERDKIQDLIVAEGVELYGKMYYLVLCELQHDIDKACDDLFSDYSYERLEDLDDGATKLAQFLHDRTRSDRKISTAAGIEKGRLNRVKNGKTEDLYAFEVYGLAKAFNLKPSQLFDFFYGNGPRPVVGD